jgi:hypothetical protein
VVFVGDPDQLPPVGAGYFLRQLLDSGLVPRQHLQEVIRQGEGSGIVEVARDINQGKQEGWLLNLDFLQEVFDPRFGGFCAVVCVGGEVDDIVLHVFPCTQPPENLHDQHVASICKFGLACK